MKRVTERKNRTTEILASARRVFLEKGYGNASMREIAAGAELSTGALYSRFRGKDEIYGRICQDILSLHIQTMEAAHHPRAPIERRLETATLAYLEIYWDHRDDFDLLDFAYKRLNLPRELARSLDQLTVRALSPLTHIFLDAVKSGELSDDADPWELTLACWAAIEGVFYLHKRDHMNGPGIELEKMARRQIRFFTLGILQEFRIKEVS